MLKISWNVPTSTLPARMRAWLAYRVLITKSARKALAAIPAAERQALEAKIQALGANPRPVGSMKLVGREGEYRIRQGNYRVIYRVEDAELIVEVIAAGHRREIYG